MTEARSVQGVKYAGDDRCADFEKDEKPPETVELREIKMMAEQRWHKL